MASSDNDDYYADDDDGEYYGTEDDEGYQSNDDCLEESSDEETAEDYVIEEDLLERQEAVTRQISGLLSVPMGYAAVFLRHCKWNDEELKNRWFLDERRVRDAVGLPPEVGVPTVLNDSTLTCAICFESYGPGEIRSAGCSHYYCHECWRDYIRAAVGNGPGCLSLRCPDPRCTMAVVRELVDEVADDEARERYAMFAVRSYVDEGTNKFIRWCPGRGCTRAVKSNVGLELRDVLCACKHGFCFRCGDEAHRPASCDTTREWMAKNSSDAETVNWVLANTKHCPECRRTIEKNQGCMHMTCSAPCHHEFCWLCLGPWEPHRGSFYSCNRYAREKDEGKFTEALARRSQAKASLDRYLHFYERWAAHGESQKKAREDLDALEGGGLEEFAETVGEPLSKDMDFLEDAYAQIVECRRVLRWTYAYVYYLDPERDAVKRELCEFIQAEAERSLERLHHCVEQERKDLCDEATSAQESKDLCDDAASAVCVTHKYRSYREKLVGLSLVMRNHFNNLVKGFEAGIAEVVV